MLYNKVFVFFEGNGEITFLQKLAESLDVPLIIKGKDELSKFAVFALTWRSGCLMLLETQAIDKDGIFIDIEHRHGEQRSWPTTKQGALAQALGKKTKTIIDATAGWGQDSLAMFRMGYKVTSIERNLVMATLLEDGYRRLAQQDWVRQLGVSVPELIVGDAITVLHELTDKPDCIYLDPMFPPKRKQSALAKKSIRLLRDLVGDDLDKGSLFAAALAKAGKRIVVKSPDDAEPLGGKPDASFRSKLVRYDVYFKK